MGIKAAIANGNWLTAATWAVVTTESLSYLNVETTPLTLTTNFTGARTAAFQFAGETEIDGIGVKLGGRVGTTGTMTVQLELDADDSLVAGTEVIINTADLPASSTVDLNGGWVFFKFLAPVTLAATTNYQVAARTSSGSMVTLFRDATAGNFARYLRTTTVGAPAATDDLIIAGDYTGAGTGATVTVTMNALASAITDYGAGATSLVTPALAICSKGSLVWGTAAATDYYLRLSGNLIVYSAGMYHQGTPGTPVPRGSTAFLQFDCTSNVEFGFTLRNGSIVDGQGLSRTSGKNVVWTLLNTDEAADSTSLGVADDTGWLDNDEVAIASTTRTAAECEKGRLNGNAGASSLTVDGFAGASGGLDHAHSGTAPTQAEVILLTRNVAIFGFDATKQAYINIAATATVDFDWVEFYWMGSGTASKRGIDVATSTGSLNLAHCSFHDFVVAGNRGILIQGTNPNNISITDCVAYNLESSFIFQNAATSFAMLVSGNVAIRTLGGAGAASFHFGSDVGATVTDNVAAGSNASGFVFGAVEALGTISRNTVHSCSGAGVTFIAGQSGLVTDLTVWRCLIQGIQFSSGVYGLILDGVTLFGNGATNISFTGSISRVTFIDLVCSGDTTFSTATGVAPSALNPVICDVSFINSSFGSASGIFTAHTTADIAFTQTCSAEIKLSNTVLASSTEISGATFFGTESDYVSSQKHDGVAGAHKTYKKSGTLAHETTTTHTGGHSLKMTPTSASGKLDSRGQYGGFFVAVLSGQTLTPSIYVYEDGSYNGARARLILKRNDAIGITADVVLDTATAASDAAWEQLTGTTAAASDDGVMEFYVDVDGSAGNVYIDTFTCA